MHSQIIDMYHYNPKFERVAIAEIVFWVPALMLAAAVCFRQRFVSPSAWLWIAVLGLSCIISSACTVAIFELLKASLKENYRLGDYFRYVYYFGTIRIDNFGTCAEVLNSLGTSFLLAALVGLQVRILKHMSQKHSNLKAFVRCLYAIILIAICLSIAGKTLKSDMFGLDDYFDFPQSNRIGSKLLRGASILCLMVWVALLGVCICALASMQTVLVTDKNLARAAAICMPFVLVRIMYAILEAFKAKFKSNNIWIWAFMITFPEFVVATILIVVGFRTPPPQGNTSYKAGDRSYMVPPLAKSSPKEAEATNTATTPTMSPHNAAEAV